MKFLEWFESIFSSAPDSASFGRFAALLVTITNIFCTIFIVCANPGLLVYLWMITECSVLLILAVLVPTKIIEFLNVLKR